MRKLMSRMGPTRRFFAIWPPMPSPIGIIAISTPSEKKPMPTMSRPAPKRKSISVPIGMGAVVKERIRTMSVTGSTEERASLIFSLSFFCIRITLSCQNSSAARLPTQFFGLRAYLFNIYHKSEAVVVKPAMPVGRPNKSE